MQINPTVLLVEDHLLILAGLRISLENLKCCQIVGAVGDGEAAVRETQRLRPDVVLMDVGLPCLDGIEATWRIKQVLPRTRIIMFTSHTTSADITAALGAGADGYCSKDTPVEQIASAISAVMRGEVWLDPTIADAIVRISDASEGGQIELSETEVRILSLIKERVDNSEIARRLDVSVERVARIMQQIIHQFMAKSESGHAEAKAEKGISHEWLTAFLENMPEEKIFADKYLIEGLIGSGGIGAVFKAKHLYMDRHVALKLLRPEFSEDRLAMRNFQREATAIGNLHHSNLVSVYDFGISLKGEPYLIMEYIDGSALGEIILKEGRILVPRLLKLCLQVCAGLTEAHSKGIIHCDLKPNNILIQGIWPNEQVKVVDFGLAQMKTAEPPTSVKPDLGATASFFICGTPLYMSPEQCYGQTLGPLSDIYSLGCIMYEALTGVNIFQGATAMETFAKQCELVPPPLSDSYDGSFSPELELCVSRMLDKDPHKRPQSMVEVRVLLQGAFEAARKIITSNPTAPEHPNLNVAEKPPNY